MESPADIDLRKDEMSALLRERCGDGRPNRPQSLDLRRIDLSGEDLRGLDLSGYDLSEANLANADLSGANLSFAKLDGAVLQNAVLSNTELMAASLSKANLNECRADSAGLGAADLSEAKLLGTILENATLSKTRMRNVDARASRMKGARLVEADLTGANLTRADIKGCDLKHAAVKRANFELADLRGSRLMGLRGYRTAKWVGVDIRDIDLRGAYMIKRHIEDENYLFEFRTRSRRHAFIYWIWWLSSDCGRSIARWGMLMVAVAALFGILYRLIGMDFGIEAGPFTPYYFSIVTLTTLGYGDIHPHSTSEQLLASAEAVLGYIGLGGLLCILAHKIARRAE